MNSLKQLFYKSTATKYFGVLLIVILVASIPLTIALVKQQQDLRQRASGEQSSVYFAPDDGSTNPGPLSSITIPPPGQQVNVRMFVNTGFAGTNIAIDSFDITINFPGLTLASVTSGNGADRFNTPFLGPPDTIDNQNHAFRFSKGSTSATANISGVLHIATLTFTAISTTGTGTVSFGRTDLASFGSLLSVSKVTINYAIGQVPSPSVGPSVTPTVGPTNGPTLTPLAADVDRNGCVGIQDYNKWAQAFQTGVVQQGTFPNINNDGQVDLLDFNQWYNAMLSLPQSRRCE